jgi:pantoate--beta-alanine ligase
MKVISTVNELQNQIKEMNLSPIGFVPTMGALHDGHLSLVEFAVKKCPFVVVSIYVNPTQFNDKNDLKNYPRTLDNDLELLKKALRKNDIVFTPSDKEMYPGEDKREFHFGNLDHVMEASQRPGHFNGVAQIISKMFEFIKPDIAIFGQKDFQQLAVIKALVKQTNDKVEIIGHPIIRENDGLALSSRNRLLEPVIRKNANIIYKTLLHSTSMIKGNDIPVIKSYVENSINKVAGFRLEYFEIADDIDLMPAKRKDEMKKGRRYYGCIAVKAGKIRLIDNIDFGVA